MNVGKNRPMRHLGMTMSEQEHQRWHREHEGKGLTRGNLSVHVTRLEHAGYVQVKKSIVGRMPYTQYRLTPKGRKALREY
jgi:DNA-binding PadR family transcriptional regulator